jgi:S1-C subfamily serine protease
VTVTPAIRVERGLRSPTGALVVEASERIARELGIQRGDVIVQINNYRVESADETARAIDAAATRGPVTLFFERGGRIYPTYFVMR